MENDEMQVYIDVIESIAKGAATEALKQEENGTAKGNEMIYSIGAPIETLLDGIIALLVNGRIDSELNEEGIKLKLIIAEVLHEKTRDELEKRRLRNGVN